MNLLTKMTKLADKNISDSADIITQHRPPKGGVCNVSCQHAGDETLVHKQVRESRNASNTPVEVEVADGGSHPAARMPRISPQTPLPRAEPS
jgi:hypothetical protein